MILFAHFGHWGYYVAPLVLFFGWRAVAELRERRGRARRREEGRESERERGREPTSREGRESRHEDGRAA